jgi:hypothetical protein
MGRGHGAAATYCRRSVAAQLQIDDLDVLEERIPAEPSPAGLDDLASFRRQAGRSGLVA